MTLKIKLILLYFLKNIKWLQKYLKRVTLSLPKDKGTKNFFKTSNKLKKSRWISIKQVNILATY